MGSKSKSHKLTYVNNGKKERSKVSKVIEQILIVLLVLGALLVPVMFTGGNVKLSLNDRTVDVKCSWYPDTEFSLDDVLSVELRDDEIEGVRKNGFQSQRLALGRFENPEFGRHSRYTSESSEKYIVVRLVDNVFILTAGDTESTEAFYQLLLEEVK